MRLRVTYEWAVESYEGEDIIDIVHSDKLKELDKPEVNEKLVLIRDEYCPDLGLQDRYWAYVEEGFLAERFTDSWGEEVAIKIPKRFYEELKRG